MDRRKPNRPTLSQKPINNQYTKPPHRLKEDINTILTKSCAHLVHRQLQLDAKNAMAFTAANIVKEHKLAVIIRKKQTHHDLAKYLHTACFQPVALTRK